MKSLNIWFEDKEKEFIEAKKKDSGLTWHDFILHSIKMLKGGNRFKDVQEENPRTEED
jgi:hypothetical protein